MKKVFLIISILTMIGIESYGQIKPNIEWVDIPAGTFIMGCPRKEKGRVLHYDHEPHKVTLSAYKMSKYEITNAQYAAFLNAKGIGSDGKFANGMHPTQTLIYDASYFFNYTNNQWVPNVDYVNHPVVNVTWYGATEFATYAGGTLPTEAQWEYACRAGTTTPFNTGNCLSNLQACYQWDSPYSSCANSHTTEPNIMQAVGSYPPNAYGLYDMHGNVKEWCSDFNGFLLGLHKTNPTGPKRGTHRVIRGGSYNSKAEGCRSAYRLALNPHDNYGGHDFGFRIVYAP